MNTYSRTYQILLQYPEVLAVYERLMKRYRDVKLVVLDVPSSSIAGRIYVDEEVVGRNMLLNNFWSYLLGFLLETNTIIYNEGGGSYAPRSSGDMNASAAMVCVGSSNIPETFTQYRLQGSYSCYSASFAIGYDDAQQISIVTVSAPSSISGYETGVRQDLYDTSGYVRLVFLNRKVLTVSAGQVVTHRFIFSMPWVLNTATLFWGLMREANVDITDIYGYRFTARTSGDANASAQKLVLSESAVSFSPTLTSLPNMISVSTYNWFLYGYTSVLAVILGVYVPDVDRTIRTLGLIQDLYDTAGTKYTALTLAYPLPTPVNVKAGIPYMFMVRIAGF